MLVLPRSVLSAETAANETLSAPRSSRRSRIAVAYAARFRCVTPTPFGNPVEPEVYMT